MAVPLFSAFGTRVKAHWSLFAFMVLLALEAREREPALALAAAVILFGSVLAHEFGHVAAARKRGMLAPEIWLTPLGGTAHLVGTFSSRGAEIAVALAGPATSAALFAVGAGVSYAAWGEFRPWTALGFFVTINGVLAVFNALPAYPMDGGVVLRALLAGRLGRPAADRTAALVGQALAAGFVVAGAFRLGSVWGWILIAIGISNFLACRRLRAEAGGFSAQPARPGLWARIEAARGRRRREKRRKVEERVDELLDKVGREGIASLSRRERKFLKKASELYKEDRTA